MAGDGQVLVFLDANVLAKPVIRTLMLRCAASGYLTRGAEPQRGDERTAQDTLPEAGRAGDLNAPR